MTPTFAGSENSQYLGRWALHFEGGMGWLEVRQEKGYLDADLLWIGGSVTPVSNVFISNGKLNVTRTSTTAFDQGNGMMRTHILTSVLELEGSGDQLIGTMMEPSKDGNGAAIFYIHANRIPPIHNKSASRYPFSWRTSSQPIPPSKWRAHLPKY